MDMMNLDIDLKLSGARIRAVRNVRKIAARQLAEQIGIGEVSLMHIECGNRRPSLQTLYRISVVLDTSLDYLCGRVEKPDEFVPVPVMEEQRSGSGRRRSAGM